MWKCKECDGRVIAYIEVDLVEYVKWEKITEDGELVDAPNEWYMDEFVKRPVVWKTTTDTFGCVECGADCDANVEELNEIAYWEG